MKELTGVYVIGAELIPYSKPQIRLGVSALNLEGLLGKEISNPTPGTRQYEAGSIVFMTKEELADYNAYKAKNIFTAPSFPHYESK